MPLGPTCWNANVPLICSHRNATEGSAPNAIPPTAWARLLIALATLKRPLPEGSGKGTIPVPRSQRNGPAPLLEIEPLAHPTTCPTSLIPLAALSTGLLYGYTLFGLLRSP